MIKKTKLFGVFFSTNILLPCSLLPVSCGKTSSETDTASASSSTSETDKQAQAFSSEIKDFVKKGITPQGNQIIMIIDDLLTDINPSIEKARKNREIVDYLDELATRLNENADEDFKLEITNKIVEDGLKKIISQNRENTAKDLKKNHTEEFSEVSDDKILEIEEESFIINLKKFSLSKILRDIEDDEVKFDEDEKRVFAESDKLKIYNFTIDLKTKLSNGSTKTNSIEIKDINLFIALDRNKADLLANGITDYLKRKLERDEIPIYLDGNHPGGKSTKAVSEYFGKIIKDKDFNLLDDVNKQQMLYYLSDIYLPGLIYKNRTTKAGEEKPIMIRSKELILDESNLNFRFEGMQMNGSLRNKLTFNNFFGNDQKKRQIENATIDEIVIDNFLKDPTVHEDKGKYYSLGTGTLEVNDWNIKGFPIKQVRVRFKIYIRDEILNKEIANLRTVLRNLLDIMSKSRFYKIHATETNFTDRYAVRIDSDTTSIKPKPRRINSTTLSFNDILDILYIQPTMEKITANITDKISFGFSTSHDALLLKQVTGRTYQYRLEATSARENEIFDIYFKFNSSFKFKISDGLLVEKTKNSDASKQTANFYNDHEFYIR